MLKIEKLNEVSIYFNTDDRGILQELWEKFSYFAENYRWHPKFKAKMWNGKIHLMNLRNYTMPLGLLEDVVAYLNKARIEYKLDSELTQNKWASTEEEIGKFIASDKFVLNEKYVPKDYQIEALNWALKSTRGIVLLPTGSGKSLVMYIIAAYALEYLLEPQEKLIIVVPGISLVNQLYSDFDEYSNGTFNKYLHKIAEGSEKVNFSERIAISTWQSAIKISPENMKVYGAIIGDEAHGFKAVSLNTIVTRLVNTRLKIGLTGTLENSTANKMQIKGLFGPEKRFITTSELQTRGDLSVLNISVLNINHKSYDDIALDYSKQVAAACKSEKRNRIMASWCCEQSGNSLVIFFFKSKHGYKLKETFEAMCPDHTIIYMDGNTPAEEREKIRKGIDAGIYKKPILLAALKIIFIGINIRNIHNLVFATPMGKKMIPVLQSIGRLLRVADNKKPVKLLDIVDIYPTGKQYLRSHSNARKKYYLAEKFPFKDYSISISEISE